MSDGSTGTVGDAEHLSIGEVLHLSEKTVRNHVSQLLRKLGFQRRSQAAAWAGQRRLELPPA